MPNPNHNISMTEEESNRREFFRNSAVAAGAVAVTAGLGISPEASAQNPKKAELEKPLQLTASFDRRHAEKITKDDVWLVLDQLFEIAGCPTCGLNGFDIRLETQSIFDLKTNIPVNVGLHHR